MFAALNVYFQYHHFAGGNCLINLVFRRAVKIAEDLSVLQQQAFFDSPLKLVPADKPVIFAVNFFRRSLSRSYRNAQARIVQPFD